MHRYPHDLFDELFDGVVISGVEKTRKPAKRMYELGAERAGVSAELCVFVDDLPFNLKPAQEMGMATVHHTAAETTILELEPCSGSRCGTTDARSDRRRQVRAPRSCAPAFQPTGKHVSASGRC